MKAARKIKASSKLSTRGKHNSTKMKRVILWESTLERDFIKLLDFDPDVTYFRFQPLKIEYIYQGKIRKYYPDFLVGKNDMKEYIYEVKAEEKTDDETNKIKFQVGMKYCHEKNMRYVVVSEKDIRKGSLVENLDILSEVREETTSTTIKYEILQTLEHLEGKCSIADLKNLMKDYEEGTIENNLYNLIYTHQISVDLYSNLICDDTIVERKCH